MIAVTPLLTHSIKLIDTLDSIRVDVVGHIDSAFEGDRVQSYSLYEWRRQWFSQYLLYYVLVIRSNKLN